MYEQIYDVKPDSSQDHDRLESKVFHHRYTPRRTVAPPEYPFCYYRLKRDQECIFCGQRGKGCHNIRYGMYLAALVTRFFRETGDKYNEFDAVKLFIDSYRTIAEYEDYLDSEKINSSSKEITIPECMAFDSLVYALNAVEWDIMWGKTVKIVKDEDE